MKTYTIDNNGNIGADDGSKLTDAEVIQLRSMMNARKDFAQAFDAGEYMQRTVEAVSCNGVTAWGFRQTR